MTRPHRDDSRLHTRADQREITHTVQRLVAQKLVVPAQHVRDDASVVENYCIVGGCALYQTLRAQIFDFVEKAERPRRGHLIAIALPPNNIASRLASDNWMRKLDRDVQQKLVRGMRLVHRVPVDYPKRLRQREIFRLARKLLDPHPDQSIVEWSGTAIEDRRLGPAHVDHEIVDLESGHRRENVLDRVDRSRAA